MLFYYKMTLLVSSGDPNKIQLSATMRSFNEYRINGKGGQESFIIFYVRLPTNDFIIGINICAKVMAPFSDGI